jgi:hypothetical protein
MNAVDVLTAVMAIATPTKSKKEAKETPSLPISV